MASSPLSCRGRCRQRRQWCHRRCQAGAEPGEGLVVVAIVMQGQGQGQGQAVSLMVLSPLSCRGRCRRRHQWCHRRCCAGAEPGEGLLVVAIVVQGQAKGLSSLPLLCRGRGRGRWRCWLAWMCWHHRAGVVVVPLLLGRPGGHGDGWVVDAGRGYHIAHACCCYLSGGGKERGGGGCG